MTDNEKIHQILEYISTNYNHGIIETDEIADELNMALSEVNILARKIIRNSDAKDGGSDKTTSKKGTISILQTSATNDAFKSEKYLNKSKNVESSGIPVIWKWIFAIIGAIAAIATIYQVVLTLKG